MPDEPSVKLAQNATWPLSLNPLGLPSDPPLPPEKVKELSVRKSPGVTCNSSPVRTTSRSWPLTSVPQIPYVPSLRSSTKAM